jgi:hypothetical protein
MKNLAEFKAENQVFLNNLMLIVRQLEVIKTLSHVRLNKVCFTNCNLIKTFNQQTTINLPPIIVLIDINANR